MELGSPLVGISFSELRACSHSLAAKMAAVRQAAGAAKGPLKTKLLRSFHSAQRIHGNKWLATTPVRGRQRVVQRDIHRASKSTISLGSKPIARGHLAIPVAHKGNGRKDEY